MKWLALVVALAITAPSPTAHAEVQAWEVLTLMTRLDRSGGPAAWFDVQLRRRGDSTQYLIRPALGWAFDPNVFFHVGYLAVPTDFDTKDTTLEHRVWEQLLWNIPASAELKLQVRLRAEQRYGATSSLSNLGHRARILGRVQYQLDYAIPLQVVVWDELFMGINTPTTDFTLERGFDQNRAFVGIGVDTTVRGLRVEAGYMNFVTQAGDRMDHVVGFFVLSNTWLRD